MSTLDGDRPRTAVIPCGGVGSRLASVLGDLPKVLAPIAGAPLLGHLLGELGRAGVREVILLAGVGAERVETAARELAPPGLRVRVVVEPVPLGTAGALGLLRGTLDERFLLVYGDLYARIDWGRLWRDARERGGLGTLMLHRSSHPEDSDVVVLDDAHRLLEWHRRGESRGSVPRLTNAALGVFHPSLLDWIPKDRFCDLTQELLPALVQSRAPLFGYTTSEYVCDMGTPERLAKVDAALASGRASLRAELVLLDRDGVLTPARTVRAPDELELLPGAGDAVRRLNERGVQVAVVTNQAAVARGLCTRETLDAIHERLRALLATHGARLDGLHVCPHHPETHHPEGVPALRGPCPCRKPSTALVERALDQAGVVPWRAMVVGDTSIDVQLAHNARLACALVGASTTAPRHPARPQWRFADLAEVVSWVTG